MVTAKVTLRESVTIAAQWSMLLVLGDPMLEV